MTHRASKFRYEFREPPEPQFGMMAGDTATPSFDDDYTTYEYVGTIDESKAIIQRIRDAVDETYQATNGDFPMTVVVGIEDYLAADAWVRYDSGNSETLDDVVSGDIVTVPGRMIHVPKRNAAAMINYLKEKER